MGKDIRLYPQERDATRVIPSLGMRRVLTIYFTRKEILLDIDSSPHDRERLIQIYLECDLHDFPTRNSKLPTGKVSITLKVPTLSITDVEKN